MYPLQTLTLATITAALLCMGPSSQVRAESPPAQPVGLTVAGSGVNLGITRLLANAFTAEHPNITIAIPGSIGTRGAIKAASEGAIALGLISRPLKDEEKAQGLVEHPYARTAIVLGAHPSVKDETISSEELVNIYRGAKTSWLDGNQIVVQAREQSDSGFLVLESTIPGFKEAYAESHEAKRWTLYFNDQEANQALASVPFAIGVTDLGMIATDRLAIKVLRFNGIEPSVATLRQGTYPLVRQLAFVYRNGSLSPEAKLFVDFVASKAGSDILQTKDYLPVP